MVDSIAVRCITSATAPVATMGPTLGKATWGTGPGWRESGKGEWNTCDKDEVGAGVRKHLQEEPGGEVRHAPARDQDAARGLGEALRCEPLEHRVLLHHHHKPGGTFAPLPRMLSLFNCSLFISSLDVLPTQPFRRWL